MRGFVCGGNNRDTICDSELSQIRKQRTATCLWRGGQQKCICSMNTVNTLSGPHILTGQSVNTVHVFSVVFWTMCISLELHFPHNMLGVVVYVVRKSIAHHNRDKHRPKSEWAISFSWQAISRKHMCLVVLKINIKAQIEHNIMNIV